MKDITGKIRVLLLAPLLVFALVLTGCGSKTSSSSNATSSDTAVSASSGSSDSSGSTGSSAGSSAASSSGTASASECPTSNTTSFAKTKFVLHMGLAAGTFHRWIYKPYVNGKFKKGASGRKMALVKAGVVALFDAHELKKAAADVKANPTLCKVMYKPISALSNSMQSLKSAITSGNFGQLTALNGAFAGLTSTASKMGINVKERTDMSADK